MSDEDWETIKPTYKNRVVEDTFLRIYKSELEDETRYHIYVSKNAYEVLGKPEYVQIQLKRQSQKIRLVNSHSQSMFARKIVSSNKKIQLSGGANLVRQGMRLGYYVYNRVENAFCWKYS